MDQYIPLIVVIILLVVIILFFVLLFISNQNELIKKKNQVKNAQGSVDALLKKRSELIPNLIMVVSKYLEHQENIIKELNETYREISNQSNETGNYQSSELLMQQKVKPVIQMMQNSVEMKSDRQVELLQRAWNEVEEQLSAARRNYNANVMSYNNAIESFPGRIYAKKLELKPRQVFRAGLREKLPVNTKKYLKGK